MSTLVNVAELMSDPDFVVPFVVRRPVGGDIDETGTFVASGYDDIAMTGIVQPASPADVQMLSEGERIGNVIEIWSKDEIKCADGAETMSDVVVYKGLTYLVSKAEDWNDNGYSHVYAEGYLPPKVPT